MFYLGSRANYGRQNSEHFTKLYSNRVEARENETSRSGKESADDLTNALLK